MSLARVHSRTISKEAFIFVVASTIAGIACCDAALADFSGRVVAVQDGDTLTVLQEKTQVKVRLGSIDAPERKQPFGTRSSESLRSLCAGRPAEVAEFGKDRYGRTIGQVHCDGIDVNAEQVRRGMAWVYTRYATPTSPLYALESKARAGRVGLWSDSNPIPPWEWRRSKLH